MGRTSKRAQRPQLARFPPIEGPVSAYIDEPCLAFHKYDGSNLQFKWTQQEGWCQFGTRKRTIDSKNPLFGDAIATFQRKYADSIIPVIRRHKEYRNTKSLVAFCEYFGDHTFSGLHQAGEVRDLKLIDILIEDQGFVLPGNFRHHFGHLDIAEIVYEGPLSGQFMRDVYEGKYPVGEGVVAKGVTSTRRRKGKTEQSVWTAKIKTKSWLEELQRRAGDSANLMQELEENLRQQSSVQF